MLRILISGALGAGAWYICNDLGLQKPTITAMFAVAVGLILFLKMED